MQLKKISCNEEKCFTLFKKESFTNVSLQYNRNINVSSVHFNSIKINEKKTIKLFKQSQFDQSHRRQSNMYGQNTVRKNIFLGISILVILTFFN